MKKNWMKITIAVIFVLSLSATAYAAHSVTVKNDTPGWTCGVSVYHRTIGTHESGTKWINAGSEVTISAPGAYCIAYLDYHCCPDAGGKCSSSRTVGCLGTSGSKAETCCWDSTWEIYYDAQAKEPRIKKTKP